MLESDKANPAIDDITEWLKAAKEYVSYTRMFLGAEEAEKERGVMTMRARVAGVQAVIRRDSSPQDREGAKCE